MPGIFISYRREDSFAYAGRLCDRLISHFGQKNVFMDVDNIEPGLDFVEVLQRTVSSCDALVAVIGKQWLAATDEEGRRRLDNPEDLVRLEIAAALDRKVRVVPTLVGGAHMPRRQDLPEALASLARRNALEISDLSFHQGIDRLIEALDKIVGRAADPAPAPASNVPTSQPSSVQDGSSVTVLAAPLVVPNLPPAATEHPILEQRVPLARTPVWRRRLLLCRPGGVGGWFFRLLFLLAGFGVGAGCAALLTGHIHGADDWGTLGAFIALAWLFWFAAFWFDKRARKGQAVNERPTTT